MASRAALFAVLRQRCTAASAVTGTRLFCPRQSFHSYPASMHKATRDTAISSGSSSNAAPHVHDIEIHFITKHRERITALCAGGDNLVDVARDHEASVGAYFECTCGGIAACSTCHVILDEETYKLFPAPDESERDMLDLAWGVTDTSRLGCQIKFQMKHSGITIVIPEQFNDLH